MLNSTTVWKSTARLKFFITYSNDIDAQSPGSFVGAAGAAKWALLVKTWVAAMQHPRYLRVGGRQVEIYWVSPRIRSSTPAVFTRGGNLLPSSYADARSPGDVIAF